MTATLSHFTEDTLVTRVFGKRFGEPLEKNKGIRTVADLFEFLPRRYLKPYEPTDLADVVEGEETTIVARVQSASTRPMARRRGQLLTVVIGDGRSTLDLTFFKPHPHKARLLPGVMGVFTGTVTRYGTRLQLAHPEYQLIGADQVQEATAYLSTHLVPVYSTTGKVGSLAVRTAMETALGLVDRVHEPVPEDLRRRRGLPTRADAFRTLHNPPIDADLAAAMRRLRYDEALVLQVVLGQRRRAAAAVPSTPRLPRIGGLLAAFDARLPFELTAGQREVGEILAGDLARDRPMHRLLQGEVGSGKTVVALRAMLAAIDAGGQAALLAPTEVLAAQHLRSIHALLGELAAGGMLGGSDIGTTVALLTGSQSAGARRRALQDVESGAAGIVIGTHALIQKHVTFADLALVVVDEQHRFGVEQRDALREKGRTPPHVLVMTATPIPRTVAMTVFGDMETVTLAELPIGRSPIDTHVVDAAKPTWVARTWSRVAEEVARGHQVYVVCPTIGEPADGTALTKDSTDEDLAWGDVEDHAEGEERAEEEGVVRESAQVYAVAEALRADPALAGVRIGILHGRLEPDAKDQVMRDFTAGRLDLLVATTVIEVGVDVPNASTMVVLDADRFGISQLHQLRGRVGRGTAKGLCLLLTNAENPHSRARLEAVASTGDGFELARRDVQLRREGDVLGARQSGRGSSIRHLRLGYRHDEDLILQARQDASGILEGDPELTSPEHADLAARVRLRVDADQAAYLERG